MPSSAAFTAGSAPGAAPLLGHAVPFLRRPLEFLTSLPAHGDLVEIRLGPQRAYVVCNLELMRQVLTDDRTFDKGGLFFDRMRDFLGNGLATCPHAAHRRQRRLMQPAFRAEQLERYGRVMARETAALVAPWREGQVIEPYSLFYRFAMRVVTRALIASEVGDDAATEIEQSFETVVSGLYQRMVIPPWLSRLPTPGNRRYERAAARLNASVDRIVDDYRRSGSGRDDLLSELFAARDEDGTGLSATEIRDQVVTLLAAGTETSAAAHTWSCQLLAEHPAVQDRVAAEVGAALGGRTVVEWEDLPRLSLTRRVVYEATRLHPAGWLLTRFTTRDVEVAGRALPSGTTLIVGPHQLHRNSDLFANPDDFDPDRWPPELGRTPSARSGYLVFGHGARRCIGDQFAVTESALTLATIVARWRLSLPTGLGPQPTRLSSIVYPRHLRLHLARRDASPT